MKITSNVLVISNYSGENMFIIQEVAGIKADAASGKLSVTIQNEGEKHTINAETKTGQTVNVVGGMKRKASQEDEDSIVADVDAILK